MRGLIYLVLHTAKNRILMVRRKPSLLILYLLFAGFIAFSFWGSTSHTSVPSDMLNDIGWLKLIFFGYLALIATTSISAGLSAGATVFEMSDVNFLFTSPHNPKQILGYALARQTVKNILASIFILMMGGTLRTFWGIGYGGLLLIFACYVFALILFQLLSMVIYIYAKGRDSAKAVVWVLVLLCLVPFASGVLIPFITQGMPVQQALLSAVNGPLFFTIPIAGWVPEMGMALLRGDTTTALIALALSLAATGLCLILLTKGKSDYYEDVLVATETAFSRKQAAKEGNLQASSANTRRIRVNEEKSGKLWGHGAAAFFGKHLVETFRRNRLKVLDASSISFIIACVSMSFFLREEGSTLMILITTMMIRTFLVGTGLGLRELYTHYIFMIPASSFAKIVWSNLEVCIKSAAESIIGFTVAGILMKVPLPDVFLSIVISTAFSILLVSINLLSMRIFSNVISQGLLITFYFLFVLFVMAPGVVAAILVGVFVPAGGILLPYGTVLLWELLLSALFFFLARGVLHNCDISTSGTSTR